MVLLVFHQAGLATPPGGSVTSLVADVSLGSVNPNTLHTVLAQ